MTDLARDIRDLLLKEGLSVREVAEELSTTQKTVYQYASAYDWPTNVPVPPSSKRERDILFAKYVIRLSNSEICFAYSIAPCILRDVLSRDRTHLPL